MLTLTQAAKETGLARSTIFKAINSGKLSASKNEHGHFMIDPAELFRVYSPVNNKNVSIEQKETVMETTETAELKARLELMEMMLARSDQVVADLRQRLDRESEERRKLSQMLLTHQPEAKPIQSDPNESPLYRKLFGKHCR